MPHPTALVRAVPEASSSTLTARIPGTVLLAAGFVLAVLTNPRFHVDALAWVAPVPWLLLARRLHGWRAWLGLLGFLVLTAIVWIAPIATSPVPLVAIVGFGPPVGLLWFATTGIAELVRRRTGELASVASFASAVAVLSWVGYALSPLGAWMSPSITQVDQLAFVQLASLGGLGLIGFVMAWTAATIASLLGAPAEQRRLLPAALAGLGLTLAGAWGAVRIVSPLEPARTVLVGAISTDLGLDEHGMPSPERLAANTDLLFARTHVAADRGARLVVWNEVATIVTPDDESGFVARAQAIAKTRGIDLVLAYAALVSREPILLDNKYVFISDTGEILDTYQKHHPVPGEPSIRGSGPLTILDRPYARVGGAICYDYDFPAMAREHAARGAELVVVPSSDWLGIDPVHTKMARIRAIEGGFSLVRSVRWAASGAFDAYGRVHAWMPATQPDFVMMASVPIGRTPTLYAHAGDWPVYASGAYLALLLVSRLVRRVRVSSRRGSRTGRGG